MKEISIARSLDSHLKRPNDLDLPTNSHLFRKEIGSIWEDEDNVHDGQWMIRLKRKIGRYFCEGLIIALIRGQLAVDVVGGVISVQFQATIIS
jgi:hypothetical protein